MSSMPAAEASSVPHRSGFVAVVGRPNVGKSTLMNKLLGEKIAIVSPKPQTTRRPQLGILTLAHAQIIFVDTPGMHAPKTALGEYMAESAAHALQDADAILFLVDGSRPPNADDERLARLIAARSGAVPVVLALNKSDILKPADVVPNSDAYRKLAPQADWMLISAARGDNLDKLLEMIVNVLPPGPQLYPPDEITQTTLRELAAEFIREAALNALEQEVPHGIAVEITEFKERQDLTYIAAVIYVERETHKSIVIGKGADMLKRIGMAARAEIERVLENKVYLELRVKVRPNWRKHKEAVQRLGYK